MTEPPPRALGFFFDFIEICGGSAGVSRSLADLGYTVAPPIELSDSKHFDITSLDLLDWVIYMIRQRRIKSAMIEPVCATFSPVARPSVRSYKRPRLQ